MPINNFRITPYLLILAITSLLTLDLSAQDTTPSTLKIDMGLNTSFLFDRLLGGNDNELTQNPYLLIGKVGNEKYKIRVGVGGQFQKTIDSEEGFADSETLINNAIDFRVGIERNKTLGKKWSGYLGIDLIGKFGSLQLIQDSGFDKVTLITNEIQYGGGIVTGLQFNINSSLSLATESLFYFKMGETQTARLFTNFPEFDDDLEKQKIQELQITLPSTIYLIYTF